MVGKYKCSVDTYDFSSVDRHDSPKMAAAEAATVVVSKNVRLIRMISQRWIDMIVRR